VPGYGQYKPAGQLVQAAAPPVLYVPAEQVRGPVVPGLGQYKPAGQLVQAAAPPVL
jgi:hypothetical protein